MVDRKSASSRGRTCAHQHRPSIPPRPRFGADVLQVEISALIVKWRALGINLLEDRNPLCRVFIALVVLPQRNAEHRELFDIPSGDHIDAKTTLPDVVGGHDR